MRDFINWFLIELFETYAPTIIAVTIISVVFAAIALFTLISWGAIEILTIIIKLPFEKDSRSNTDRTKK